MPPSSIETCLDDYFMPLQMDSTRVTARRSTPKRTKRDSCPVITPRKRSIRFADEDRQLLEAVMLFEADESFTESFSLMDESYESHSSFDSFEYAHGGNCPHSSSINILSSSQDIKIPVNIVALENTEGPSLEEVEQQVREEQARELRELEELQESQNQKSAPAKVSAMVEPTTPVEVAQQKLKAEKLRNAREEEKQQVLEQARKEREEEEEEEEKKQQQQEREVRRVVSEPPKGTQSTLAQRRASFEQTACQKQQQEEEEKKQQQQKEVRRVVSDPPKGTQSTLAKKRASFEQAARQKQQQEEGGEEKKQQQQKEVRRVVSDPPKGTQSTLAQKRASFEQAARQKQQQEEGGEEKKQQQQKEVLCVVSEHPVGTKSTLAEKRGSFEQAACQKQLQQLCKDNQNKDKLEDNQNKDKQEFRQAREIAKKAQENQPQQESGKGKSSGKENNQQSTVPAESMNNKQQQLKGVRRIASEPPKGTISTLAQKSTSQQPTAATMSKHNSKNNVPAWKKRDAELLQKAREEAALRQQRAKEEAESLKGAAHRKKLAEEELTAARNAKFAQQKRQNELEDVGRYGKVGTNAYSRRERGVVRIQAVARGLLVRRGMRRYKSHSACVLVQRNVRGFLVRRDIAVLQNKIANLEEHLKAMEEAKQEELKFIQNNPEIAALIDQLDDAHATAIRKQKELKQERLDLRSDIDSVKEHNEQIAQAMENLRINNRKIAKHTRMMEEQVPRLKQRIRTYERSHAQFQEKADQWAGKVRALRRELVQANRKLESEARVADLAHATILSIREHVKELAKTSSDPFLAKIKKRAVILERLNNAGSNGRDSVQSCPVIIMSR